MLLNTVFWVLLRVSWQHIERRRAMKLAIFSHFYQYLQVCIGAWLAVGFGATTRLPPLRPTPGRRAANPAWVKQNAKTITGSWTRIITGGKLDNNAVCFPI
ncbi:hypothetical protein PgNI_05687 [Pyricularia grisea]|uniref:Uncharacterized protein n=1 Tax=Pyricularia grisea TaxID=148305 RepID=A0A6P8B555_PYRGI|nr:hypothetical protein PgNI_05687 [Pyricularia grisea]TLD10390.1 hypothetical protein PgNI_05687 [Pyricularia grisea]